MGLALGAVASRMGGCRTGACPATKKPITWVLFGGLLGAMVAFGTGSAAAAGGLDVPSLATPAEFEAKVLKSPTPVVVDFFATWCQPCHMLEPTLAAVEADYRGRVAFYRVDVDKAPELAKNWGIEAMPTVMVFDKGRPLGAPIVGLHAEGDYRAALDKALKG